METYKETFDVRHEFESEDLEILRERWPGIRFVNIPDAWIFIIDEMLGVMRYDLRIKEIRQEYGQFIVVHDELSDSHKKILKKCEAAIYKTDVDLFEQLGPSHELEN